MVAGRRDDALGARPTRRQVRRIRIAADVRAAELHRRSRRLRRSPKSFVASQPLLASEPLLRKRRGWRRVLSIFPELLASCSLFATGGICTGPACRGRSCPTCSRDAEYGRSAPGCLKFAAPAGAKRTWSVRDCLDARDIASPYCSHRAHCKRAASASPAAGRTCAGPAESAHCRSGDTPTRETRNHGDEGSA
jgi:hypothetical protein